MKIVVISECTAREMLVVQKIIDHYPNTTVIQPIYPRIKNSLKKLPKKIYFKIQYHTLKQIIYGNSSIPKPRHHYPVPMPQLNSEVGIKLIKEISPDILITCRSPILCKEIFQAPRISAINVHYGIPPKYRGNDSLFWALYFKDYENMGGCIHYITSKVDAGNILAKVYPPLSKVDNELSIGIKTSKLLAETLIEYLCTVENSGISAMGKSQIDNGRNYKYSERTLIKSIKVDVLKFFKAIKLPSKQKESLPIFL